MHKIIDIRKKTIVNNIAPKKTLGVLPLIFITAALFMTLRNMPIMAETGLHMVFFNIITVFAFLIPIALVSAELATGWPEGGVYHWVNTAFGKRAGFLAVWFQWTQSLFGITSILAYIGGTFAYAFQPALADNKFFIAAVIIITYWFLTLINLMGTARSGLISTVALSLGVLLPTIILILLAAIYALADNPLSIDLALSEKNILPSLFDAKGLVLFLSFVFGFVGIEVSASHAREVVNPQRNFPIAIFVAAIVGFLLTLLGGFSISFIIPAGEIDLINGATQAISRLLTHFQLSWFLPIVALLIALGAAGQVSTWIVGPVRGLWDAGRHVGITPSLQKLNKHDVPVPLLLVQAVAISVLGGLFLLTDDIESLFLILTSIAIILYAVMYMMMFVAAVYLRYSHPEVPRAYRVPGGNIGMLAVCGVGFFTALACLFIGFIPPTPDPFAFWTFEILLISVCLITFIIGMIIPKKQFLSKQTKGA